MERYLTVIIIDIVLCCPASIQHCVNVFCKGIRWHDVLTGVRAPRSRRVLRHLQITVIHSPVLQLATTTLAQRWINVVPNVGATAAQHCFERTPRLHGRSSGRPVRAEMDAPVLCSARHRQKKGLHEKRLFTGNERVAVRPFSRQAI